MFTIAIRVLRTLATGLLIVLITVLLGESVLRVSMQYSWTSPLYVSDPDIGFRMRPAITPAGDASNSAGFNDIEHRVDKSPDAIRLAIIGDSFVFGVVPRSENFTSVVQRLAAESGRNVEVLNMGLPAAGPRNYVGMIGKDAADLHVDSVGVVLFLGNDVLQAQRMLRESTRLIRERVRKDSDGAFSRESFLAVEAQRSVVFAADPSDFVRDSIASAVQITQQM